MSTISAPSQRAQHMRRPSTTLASFTASAETLALPSSTMSARFRCGHLTCPQIQRMLSKWIASVLEVRARQLA